MVLSNKLTLLLLLAIILFTARELTLNRYVLVASGNKVVRYDRITNDSCELVTVSWWKCGKFTDNEKYETENKVTRSEKADFTPAEQFEKQKAREDINRRLKRLIGEGN